MSNLTGITKVNGVPESCMVRAFRRDTGEMTHEVQSDPITGEYTLIDVFSFFEYDIVCLPPSDGITPDVSGPISGDPSDEFFASGGIETEIDVDGTTYRVHTFTESSTFTIQGGQEKQAEYLIVGGGGAGGANNTGGGGGAGGVVTGTLPIYAGAHPIVVGSGGAGVSGNDVGGNGEDSSAFDIVAFGGGGGGAGRSNNPPIQKGQDGGSGGGGGGTWSDSNGPHPGGTGIVGQGNDGASGINTASTYSRRGGGAGGAGAPGSSGSGGDGIPSSISGSEVYYGGGGGAGSNGSHNTSGGIGGGGRGGSSSGGAQSGQPNSGGGGGGRRERDSSPVSGDGGTGIVIIRYPV